MRTPDSPRYAPHLIAGLVGVDLDAAAGTENGAIDHLRDSGALILVTSNRANPVLGVAGLVPQRVRAAIKRAGAGVDERDVVQIRYRGNTPWRLQILLRRAAFVPVEVTYVATLHRYVERWAFLVQPVLVLERWLPPQLRSTIVAWYSPAQVRDEPSAPSSAIA